MVQEFHVLRCFSCQTFQVQQVKKSKKWTCNMCGEKQSLIKEYGRGTGADCRRHVQKLNSLRGELLEVANERARTQWEKDEERDVIVGSGNETQSWQQKEHTQAVSRWSKYVHQKENGPGSEEDENEEEVRVYTDTDQRHRHHNIRKRKKTFITGAACGRDAVNEVEDTDTGQWGAAKRPSQPRRHNGAFKSSLKVPCSSAGFQHASTSQRTDALCAFPASSLGSKDITAYNDICSQFTGANKQSSAELSTKPQHTVPLSNSFPSFTQQRSETKTEAKDSKWARFLPSVCVEDRDEGDTDLDVDHAALAQSPVTPVATVPLKNTGCMSSGGSEGALLEKVFGVGKVIDFEKVSHCMNGNVCKQPESPTIASRPVGSQEPVCVQPLPIKRPRPVFSFSTLFHTDDDFDDTY
ncbi:MRN complex-interacting protein isoform X2 [Hemibagrus wyckioides]|uniref:MRN complex-interacting protein isoform X2 n=1 Tax=Hemibagrus wyckioides TaxID=337641 RepID=UPI00266CCF41|nr:MRN complex-interacting protein isoform X2 [Hemibagrus wyckioides]